MQSTKELSLYTAPRSSFSLLFLNTTSALFNQKPVRQALAFAIDRNRLVQNVLGGQAIVAEGPFVPNSWAYQTPENHYGFDPAKAGQLLDAQGWRLDPATGVRQKEGEQFRFTLQTNDDRVRVAAAQEIARQLQEAGIAASVTSSGVADLVRNALLPRKYDAILYGIDPGSDPDPFPFWDSSQASGNGLNLSLFSDQQANSLLEQARTTGDIGQRRALYQRFQVLFEDQLPSIPLYFPIYTYAVDQKVKGISVGVLYDPDRTLRKRTGGTTNAPRAALLTGTVPPLITLLTDFGLTDTYVGQVKGDILGIAAGAQVVDITHALPPRTSRGCVPAVVSRRAHFPRSTIHVAVVDPGVGTARRASRGDPPATGSSARTTACSRSQWRGSRGSTCRLSPDQSTFEAVPGHSGAA